VTSATTTTDATATTVDPVQRVGVPSIEAKETPGWPAVLGGGLLVDVRVGRHDGFDRVVFEFDGTPPSYSVRFVGKPVHADPSDEVVPLKGEAALVVHVHGSGVDPSGSRPPHAYQGPWEIVPEDASAIRELVSTSDYEGLLIWAIGLDDEKPFAVATLQDPSRLVVDIDHAG
jgi:hypothetical protein